MWSKGVWRRGISVGWRGYERFFGGESIGIGRGFWERRGVRCILGFW